MKVKDGFATEYSVIQARHEHLPALSAIELAAAQMLQGHAPQHALAETTSIDTFRRAADAGRLWVALAGDMPVGFALVEMLSDDLPHLDELDVRPDQGRRGLGTALVQAVCRWAEVSGFAQLTLTTFRDVAWNMPFYSRLGFSELPRAVLSRELLQVVAAETRRGLDPDARVVMAYPCKRSRS